MIGGEISLTCRPAPKPFAVLVALALKAEKPKLGKTA